MYFREIGLYRRVDVGIDPYEKAGKFQKPRRGGSCVRPCEPYPETGLYLLGTSLMEWGKSFCFDKRNKKFTNKLQNYFLLSAACDTMYCTIAMPCEKTGPEY